MHKPYLNVQELQQINRETILAFIPQQPQQIQQQQQQLQQLQQQQIPQIQKPMFETKQEKSQREFEERQNIYKQMNTKPELPSPEIFKDKYEEDAIENMDVLINQYQKQREIEFNQFIPPPPVSQLQPQSQQNKNPRIRILEDISEKDKEKISIEVETEETKEKKKVSFSPNNQEYTTDDYWEKKFSQLEERIFLLEEKIANIEIKGEVSLSLENIIQKIK
jgi:hypothetical protein